MFPWKVLIGPAVLLGLKAANVKYDDPANLLVIRCVYGVSQGLLFALCAYIYHAIMQRGDVKKSVKVPAPRPAFNAAPNEPPVESTLTYKEYDLSELIKLAKNFAMGATITVGIHYYMAVVPALILQIVAQPVTLFEHPLFSIYVLDKDAGKHQNLKRPFADTSPTAQLEAMKKAAATKQQEEPEPQLPLEQSESETLVGEDSARTSGNVEISQTVAEKRPARSSSTPQREE